MERSKGRQILLSALVALGAVPGILAPRAAHAQFLLENVQASPALPAEGEPFTISADLVVDGIGGAAPPEIDGTVIQLPVAANINTEFGPLTLHVTWTLPALPAGFYMLDINLNGFESLYSALTVRPRSTLLGLVGGRFQVSLAAGAEGAAPNAVQLSDSGGYYTFFSSSDVEITAKIVDGRAVNDHFWVFIASMTNTPFAVTITDTSVAGCVAASNCPARTYTNAAGTNQNFIDVGAF